jgi:hypothetical protein
MLNVFSMLISHLYIFLLVICISSLEKSPSPLPILNGFLLSSCRISVYQSHIRYLICKHFLSLYRLHYFDFISNISILIFNNSSVWESGPVFPLCFAGFVKDLYLCRNISLLTVLNIIGFFSFSILLVVNYNLFLFV